MTTEQEKKDREDYAKKHNLIVNPAYAALDDKQPIGAFVGYGGIIVADIYDSTTES